MIFELLLIAVSAFIIGLSGAMAPGPLLTITIAESMKRGPWVGPLITIGHSILELSLVVAIVLGLGAFFQSPTVQTVLFSVGGAMLLLMAVLTWQSSKADFSHLFEVQQVSARGHLLRLPLLGIIISLSNPYWTLWWVTVGMTYLGVAIKYKWLGVAAFFIGHILSDFGWYTLISISLGTGRKLISPRWYKYILMFCAAGLLIFAVWFLKKAIELLSV